MIWFGPLTAGGPNQVVPQLGAVQLEFGTFWYPVGFPLLPCATPWGRFIVLCVPPSCVPLVRKREGFVSVLKTR